MCDVSGIQILKGKMDMEFYQDRISKLLKELRESLACNFDNEQVERLNASLQQFGLALKNVTENISLQFLNEDMKNFIAETKESEKLSQTDFEEKYSYEMEVCKKLGRAGWVISEHSNPREIKEWYDFLSSREDNKIISYFEGDNGYLLENIFHSLEHKYCEEPNQRYFSKAKYYFEQEDYMTSAMYLVAVIEARTNELMNYPKGTRYKQKYSIEGFEEHLQAEFGRTDSFFTKRFLFLDMYPSIIEFLNRLFVDGEYSFENGVEPPYINRNWLLHGKSCRVIERYECIQLFNALSVIEFVFSISNRLR